MCLRKLFFIFPHCGYSLLRRMGARRNYSTIASIDIPDKKTRKTKEKKRKEKKKFIVMIYCHHITIIIINIIIILLFCLVADSASAACRQVSANWSCRFCRKVYYLLSNSILSCIYHFILISITRDFICTVHTLIN